MELRASAERGIVIIIAMLIASAVAACGTASHRRPVRVIPTPTTLPDRPARPAPEVALPGEARPHPVERIVPRATPYVARRELFVKSGSVMREVRLSLGEPVGAFGTLSHEDVAARIRDGAFGLVRAYAQQILTGRSELRGTISLVLTGGEVEVVATTLGHPELEAAVAAKVHELIDVEGAAGGLALTFDSRAFGEPWPSASN